MSETFVVEKYDPLADWCNARDEGGRLRRVDFIVSGCLPEGTKPEDLVGKTIRVEYTHPYIELAEGVEILEPPK